ncbi:MAG: hypothetical protein IIZ13_04765 [Renibacterium sp.]|nr:hypothetical protein [Renibacterium sp.]
MRRLVAVLVAVFVTMLAVLQPVHAEPAGSFSLQNQAAVVGDTLTFNYRTGLPDALNWIALYDDPGKGPSDQKYHAPSSTWDRAPKASGSLSLSSAKLTAGHDIAAYFLAKDGYTWLAPPITFRLTYAGANGSLVLTNPAPSQGDGLSFSYRTDRPNPMNWIGLYDPPSGGPSDQKYHSGSTTWLRAPEASGTITIPSGALRDSRDIAAYFLFDDGYSWLAPPVTFQLKPQPPYDGGPRGPHWVTDAFTTATSVPGSKVSVPVSGLWFGTDDRPPAAPVLSKTGGDDWLSLGPDGVITGTAPEARDEPYRIEVAATDPAGAKARLLVDVPVGRGAVTLKTASLNAWNGGGHVNNPVEKLAKTVLLNRFDVVGLQDSSGLAAKLAARLAGNTAAASWQSSEDRAGNALLSRYPMQTSADQQPAASAASSAAAADLPAIHASVQVGDRTVSLWSAALDSADYGPAAACAPDAPGPDVLLQREKSTKRFAQAQALAKVLASDISAKTPTIVFGSLASPSGADWTAAANRCSAGAVAWPVPEQLSGAGLHDAFRALNPDPQAQPGNTNNATGPTAIPDRTDYVFAAGALKPLEAHVLVDGFPKPQPDVLANSWISDHAAVVASFELSAVPETGNPGTGNPGTGDPSTGDPGSGSAGAVPGSRPDGSTTADRLAQPDADALAFTGAEAWLWLVAAVVLITLGGTVLIAKGNFPARFRRSAGRK